MWAAVDFVLRVVAYSSSGCALPNTRGLHRWQCDWFLKQKILHSQIHDRGGKHPLHSFINYLRPRDMTMDKVSSDRNDKSSGNKYDGDSTWCYVSLREKLLMQPVAGSVREGCWAGWSGKAFWKKLSETWRMNRKYPGNTDGWGSSKGPEFRALVNPWWVIMGIDHCSQHFSFLCNTSSELSIAITPNLKMHELSQSKPE